MAQDIDQLIPEGAKQDLEDVSKLWDDIVTKVTGYVKEVQKISISPDASRTLISMDESLAKIAESTRRYEKALQDMAAAQQRAAESARDMAKAEESSGRGVLSYLQKTGDLVKSFGELYEVRKKLLQQSKSEENALKAIGVAILSGKAAIQATIQLIAMFSDEILGAAGKVKILTNETDVMNKVVSDSIGNYAGAAAELDVLKRRFFDATTSVKDKYNIISTLNEKYSDMVGSIDSLNEAEHFFVKQSADVVRVMQLKAESVSIYNIIAANEGKAAAMVAKEASEVTSLWQKVLSIFDMMDELGGTPAKGNTAKGKGGKAAYEQSQEDFKAKVIKDTEERTKQQNTILKKRALALLEELQSLYNKYGIGSGGSGNKLPDLKIKLQPSLDESEIQRSINEMKESEGLRQALSGFNSSQAEIGKKELEAKLAAEKQYASGAIGYEKYEHRKTEIAFEYGQKRIEADIEFLKKSLEYLPADSDKRLEFEKSLQEAEIELLQQSNIRKVAAEKEMQQKRNEEAEKALEEKKKQEEAYANKKKELEKDLAEKTKKLQEDVGKAAMQIADAILSKKIKNLDKEKSRLDREKDITDKRIDAEVKAEETKIRGTLMTEEEKEIALAEVQEQAAMKKLAAEQQYANGQEAIEKRKAQLERDKFMMEQMAAVGNVAITAAQEIFKIKVIAAALAADPLTIALSPIALAQIPIVAAGAAASSAGILAQVLAYAEGTPEGGHPGGAALVGEGGQPELVKMPGREAFWVSQPTLFPDMAGGTHVWPLDMLDSYLMPQLYGQELKPKNSGLSTQKLERKLDAVTRAIKNKPVANFHIADGAIRKSVVAGNNKYQYIKRNIH